MATKILFDCAQFYKHCHETMQNRANGLDTADEPIEKYIITVCTAEGMNAHARASTLAVHLLYDMKRIASVSRISQFIFAKVIRFITHRSDTLRALIFEPAVMAAVKEIMFDEYVVPVFQLRLIEPFASSPEIEDRLFVEEVFVPLKPYVLLHLKTNFMPFVLCNARLNWRETVDVITKRLTTDYENTLKTLFAAFNVLMHSAPSAQEFTQVLKRWKHLLLRRDKTLLNAPIKALMQMGE